VGRPRKEATGSEPAASQASNATPPATSGADKPKGRTDERPPFTQPGKPPGPATEADAGRLSAKSDGGAAIAPLPTTDRQKLFDRYLELNKAEVESDGFGKVVVSGDESSEATATSQASDQSTATNQPATETPEGTAPAPVVAAPGEVSTAPAQQPPTKGATPATQASAADSVTPAAPGGEQTDASQPKGAGDNQNQRLQEAQRWGHALSQQNAQLRKELDSLQSQVRQALQQGLIQLPPQAQPATQQQAQASQPPIPAQPAASGQEPGLTPEQFAELIYSDPAKAYQYLEARQSKIVQQASQQASQQALGNVMQAVQQAQRQQAQAEAAKRMEGALEKHFAAKHQDLNADPRAKALVQSEIARMSSDFRARVMRGTADPGEVGFWLKVREDPRVIVDQAANNLRAWVGQHRQAAAQQASNAANVSLQRLPANPVMPPGKGEVPATRQPADEGFTPNDYRKARQGLNAQVLRPVGYAEQRG